MVVVENPVLDPGFEMPAGSPWRTTGRVVDGALRLTAGETATQAFEGATSGAAGAAAYRVDRLREVVFRAEGAGTVDVLLLSSFSQRTFPTTPVAFTEGLNRIPFAAFDAQGGTAEDPADLANVVSITFEAGAAGANLDDITLTLHRGTRETALVRFGIQPVPEAHDGMSVLGMPLEGGAMLATVIEHGPSGARVLPVDPARATLVATGTPADERRPAATPVDLSLTPYARLFAEAGLTGSAIRFDQVPAGDAWRITAPLLPGTPSLSTETPRGLVHLGKLADPANPVNDALDAASDSTAFSLAPLMFVDRDHDGWTDAVEITLGSDLADPADVPGRDHAAYGQPTQAAVRATSLADVRVIVSPVATFPAFATPGTGFAIELDLGELPQGLAVTAVPSSGAFREDKRTPLTLVGEPRFAASERYPDRTVVRQDVLIPAGIDAAALGRLHDVRVTWTGGEDAQPRALMPLAAFPTDPLIAVIASPGVDAITGAGVAELRALAREIDLLGPDLVLVAGDLTSGAPDINSYRLARDALGIIDAPVVAAPGDNDLRATAVFDGKKAWESVLGPRRGAFSYGGLHVLVVDTYDRAYADRVVPASPGGSVRSEQMRWITTQLAAHPASATKLVLAHHSPAVAAEATGDLDPGAAQPDAGLVPRFLRGVRDLLPAPLDAPVNGLAQATDAPAGWSGANRDALRKAFRDHGVDVVLTGHALVDRVAVDDPSVVHTASERGVHALTPDDKETAATLADVQPGRAGTVLYLDTTAARAPPVGWAGYRLLRLGDLRDGYDGEAPAAPLAGIATLGMLSFPSTRLTATAERVAASDVTYLNATSTLKEPVQIRVRVGFASSSGIPVVAGASGSVARDWTHGSAREAEARLPLPAQATTRARAYLDHQLPVPTIAPLPAWTNADAISVTVTATDDRDVAATWLDARPEGGPWTRACEATGAAPLVCSVTLTGGDILTSLRAGARDLAGRENVSLVASTTRDTIAPLAVVQPLASPYVSTASPTVVVTKSDVGSQVASVTMRLREGSTWTSVPYDAATGVVTLPRQGAFGLEAIATDAAGNVEPILGVDEAAIVYDITAPALSVQFGAPGTGQPLPVEVTATDAIGPIAVTGRVTIDGVTSEFSFTPGGAGRWVTGTTIPETATTISLDIDATDGAGNRATHSTGTLPVADATAPQGTDVSAAHAQTGVPYSIRVRAADNREVAYVTIRAGFDGEALTARDVTKPGEDHVAVVAIPRTSTRSLVYEADVTDTAGLVTSLPARTVTVVDVESPVATLTPPSGWHGGPVTLSAEATDNIGVAFVRFHVRDPSGAWSTFDDASAPYAITYAPTASGRHLVAATAFDAAGNTMPAPTTGDPLDVDVQAPVIALDVPGSGGRFRAVPTLAGPVAFGPSAGSVTLTLVAPDGTTTTREAALDAGRWSVDVGDITFVDGAWGLEVTARSTSGLTTTIRPTFVIDATAPQVVIAMGEARTGQRLRADVTLTDATDAPTLVAEFMVDGARVPTTLTRGAGTTWTAETDLATSAQTVALTLTATDAVGNAITLTTTGTPVADATAPTVTDASPAHATTGDPYVIRILAADNRGIGAVTIRASVDGAALTSVPAAFQGGAYLASVHVPATALGPVRYEAIVDDVNGLRTTIPIRSVAVLDDDAPVATLVAPSGWISGPTPLVVQANDNRGIASVRFDIVSDAGTVTIEDVSAPYETVLVPAANGRVTVRATVTDTSGNVLVVPTAGAPVDVDLVVPLITSRLPDGSVAAAWPTLEGTARFGQSGGTVTIRFVAPDGAVTRVPATFANGDWRLEASAAPALRAGTWTIAVEALSGSGILAVETARITLDTTPPVIDLRAPARSPGATVGVQLGVQDATPVTVELGRRFAPPGGAWGPWVSLGAASPGTLTLARPDGEGRYSFRAIVRDAAGNLAQAEVETSRDDTPPTIVRTSPTRAPVDAPYTFTFQVSDAGGVTSLVLSTTRDDGEVREATLDLADARLSVPVLTTTRGIAWTATATDTAGNTRTTTGTIEVFPTRVASRLEFTTPRAVTGWYLVPVAANVVPADPLAAVYHRVTPTGHTPGPFTATPEVRITTSGSHRIEHYAGAIDGAPSVQTIDVDLDDPTLRIDVPTTLPEHERVVVRAHPHDATSGPAQVVLDVETNGARRTVPMRPGATGAWEAAIGPFRMGDSIRLFGVVTDAAGRTGTSPAAAPAVSDGTPPIVSLDAPSRSVGVVTLSATVLDEAGVRHVAFYEDDRLIAIDATEPYAIEWDTRGSTNARHVITAVAVDTSGNEGRDSLGTDVANPPVIRDFTATASTDGASFFVVAFTFSGRDPAVTLYYRFGRDGTTFNSRPMERVPGTDRYEAVLDGPFPPGVTVEAYATAVDGNEGASSPEAGVVGIAIPIPLALDLATWRDISDHKLEPMHSLVEPEHKWVDIQDAQFHQSRTYTTFGFSVEQPFNYSSPAFYYVELLPDADAEPRWAFNLTYPVGGSTWSIGFEDREQNTLVPYSNGTLSVRTNELTLRVPTEDLRQLTGQALHRFVRFHAIGSEDFTVARPIDLTSPVITHTPLTDMRRGERVVITASATDPSGLDAFEVQSWVDGIGRAPIAVGPSGTVDLGVVEGHELIYNILVWDAYGNLAVHGPHVVRFRDETPPIARIDAVDDVPEGTLVRFSSRGSTDDVGVVASSWDFDDRDGLTTEATGSNVARLFPKPGRYVVTLRASDAAGNVGTTTLTLTVRDATPPVVRIASPAPGALVGSVEVPVRVTSDDTDIALVEMSVDHGPWLVAAPANGGWERTVRASEGRPLIEVRATDTAGNVAATVATTVEIDISPPVVAFLGSSRGGIPQRPVDIGIDVIDTSAIASIVWDFADGVTMACAATCATAEHTTGGPRQVTHVFTRAGEFGVTVRVTDAAGQTTTAKTPFFIGYPPNPHVEHPPEPKPPAPPAATPTGTPTVSTSETTPNTGGTTSPPPAPPTSPATPTPPPPPLTAPEGLHRRPIGLTDDDAYEWRLPGEASWRRGPVALPGEGVLPIEARRLVGGIAGPTQSLSLTIDTLPPRVGPLRTDPEDARPGQAAKARVHVEDAHAAGVVLQVVSSDGEVIEIPMTRVGDEWVADFVAPRQGAWSLRAVARDAAGHVATSDEILLPVAKDEGQEIVGTLAVPPQQTQENEPVAPASPRAAPWAMVLLLLLPILLLVLLLLGRRRKEEKK